MKIRMLSTHRGSEDGFDVRCYEQGHVYDVREGMGCEFLRKGWAVCAPASIADDMDELALRVQYGKELKIGTPDFDTWKREREIIAQNYDAGYNATLCDTLEALNGLLAVNLGVKHG